MGLCPSRNVERDRDSGREDEESPDIDHPPSITRVAPEVMVSTAFSTGINSLATTEDDTLEEAPSLGLEDQVSLSLPETQNGEPNGAELNASTEVSLELPSSALEDTNSETEAFFSSQSQILVIVLPRRSPTERPRVVLVVFDNSQSNPLSNEESHFQNILNQLFQMSQPKTHPTSKRVLKMLPETCVDETLLKKSPRCVICCEEFSLGQSVIQMPCNHVFEKACVEPWLKENNTCPVCRYELPVEDEEYEQQRRQRMKQSRGEVDETSFFGNSEDTSQGNDGKSEQPDL